MSKPGDDKAHSPRCWEHNRKLASFVCVCSELEQDKPSYLGHPNEVLRLIERIERLAEGQGNGVIQRALAAALWRVTVRHPSVASCEDRETAAIVVRDGGRLLTLELRLFPSHGGG